METKRGVLIILEGIDQSGKSSATRRIKELLNEKGKEAIIQPFPDRSTEIGQLIDAFLHGKQLPQQVVHLLYSANRWEVSQKIIKYLQDGITVICDRYAFSGIVYSIAKDNQVKLKNKGQKNFKLTLQKPIIQLTKNNEVINEFPSVTEAAKWCFENNLCITLNSGVRSHIAEAANGKRKTAYGFIWKYK